MSHINTDHNCSLQKSNMRHPDIFEELPVKLHNSHLITSFIHQLQCPTSSASTELPSSLAALESSPFSKTSTLTPNLDNLSLSIDPFLEKNCDLLLDSIETVSYTHLTLPTTPYV